MTDPAAAAAAITRALRERGVPHGIGGAIALAFWGVPRATKDLDLNVFVGEHDLDPVLAALTAAGCKVDGAQAIASATTRGDFTCHLEDMRIDVFVAFHPFHDAVSARLVEGPLPDGTPTWFLSAEDLAVFKTLFWREKDLADLDRLFAARGSALDFVHVCRWVDELLGAADLRPAELRARHARVMASLTPLPT